jgi:hypothetical protein
LNSATEPQARGVSVRLLFNPQHWLTIPFGHGCGLPTRSWPAWQSGRHRQRQSQ